MKRAWSGVGWEAAGGSLFRLVSVGADVGVSIAAPQEPQKRFPSGTSLAHDGQVATIPSSRRGRGSGQLIGPLCAERYDYTSSLISGNQRPRLVSRAGVDTQMDTDSPVATTATIAEQR